MTWLIFCSLAFCAFQIVFAAHLAEDIAASIDKSTDPINNANAQAYADTTDLISTVKSKEIMFAQVYNKCTTMTTDADKTFDKIYQTKQDKCQQCYDKAKNTKDIQNAQNCCQKIAEEFKTDVKSFKTQAKKCVADIAHKCAKSATECRKEARNADKAHDELMKDMEKKNSQKYKD